jgi:hypothetical protein
MADTTVDQMASAIAAMFAKKKTPVTTIENVDKITTDGTVLVPSTRTTSPDLMPAVRDMFSDVVAKSDPAVKKQEDGTYTSPEDQIVSEKDEKADIDPLGELFNEETERVKREQEAALLAQKKGIRDSMLAERLGYEEQAIDYVNSMIAQEQSNAALFGIDYKMDDEIKQNRINSYFATMWTDQQEQELGGMITEYGKPEGFSDFIAQRGSNFYSGRNQASRTMVNRSRGIKTPEDFENILTGYMPLGGVDSILGA